MTKRTITVNICMNEERWAEATINLTKAIQKWADGACEDIDTGFWYDDVVFDMAKAAIAILKASTKGQQYYQREMD